MQIQSKDLQYIVSSERKLTCGPMVLNGKKAEAPDIKVFSFKISEEEFNGLNQLPLVSPCVLSVTLTNNIGSQGTKTFPMTISFDRHPTLRIKKISLREIPPLIDGDWNFLAQQYQIRNILPYPVGFHFTANHDGKAHPVFNYVIRYSNGAPDTKPQMIMSKKTWHVLPTHIVLEGTPQNVDGDFKTFVNFMVPPDVFVVVDSFAHVPDWIRREETREGNAARIFPFVQSFTRKLVGIYPSSLMNEDKEHSLMQWKGFTPAESDFEDPIDPQFTTKEEVPIDHNIPDIRSGAMDIDD